MPRLGRRGRRLRWGVQSRSVGKVRRASRLEAFLCLVECYWQCRGSFRRGICGTCHCYKPLSAGVQPDIPGAASGFDLPTISAVSWESELRLPGDRGLRRLKGLGGLCGMLVEKLVENFRNGVGLPSPINILAAATVSPSRSS